MDARFRRTAVEAPRQECMSVASEGAGVARRYAEAATLRELRDDALPGARIVPVLAARKFGDPEIPLGIDDGRLRARAAERGAGGKQETKPLIHCGIIVVRIVLDRAARGLEFAQPDERRRCARVAVVQERTVGGQLVSERPGTKCVVNAEQVLRVAEA